MDGFPLKPAEPGSQHRRPSIQRDRTPVDELQTARGKSGNVLRNVVRRPTLPPGHPHLMPTSPLLEAEAPQPVSQGRSRSPNRSFLNLSDAAPKAAAASSTGETAISPKMARMIAEGTKLVVMNKTISLEAYVNQTDLGVAEKKFLEERLRTIGRAIEQARQSRPAQASAAANSGPAQPSQQPEQKKLQDGFGKLLKPGGLERHIEELNKQKSSKPPG